MKSEENEFNIEKRKSKVKEMMKEAKSFIYENLNELEKLDDTNKDVLIANLRISKNNELLIKSYDVLQKK